MQPAIHSNLTFGYGHGEGWLLSAMVYRGGIVQFRYFDLNLTEYDGFYAKTSHQFEGHEA